jgi:hypothetical protein
MTPGINDFRAALHKRLTETERNGESHCDVKAGELHREVGRYPDTDQDMPTCCEAMRQAMTGKDRILEAPGNGVGPLLLVRYILPRMKP